MYPAWELKRIAAHKSALRKRIALRRITCFASAARLARPLAWVDRVVAFWRRLPSFAKFAALPLGVLFQRKTVSRRGILGTFARWGPLVFSAVRGFTGLTKGRAGRLRERS